MFDIGWGELLLIGGVALVVIGPEDLPKALRTLGAATSKLKRMAAEFQGQFNEAMRDAELDEIRKSVAGMSEAARDLNQGFNPIQTIRDEIKGAIDAQPPAASPTPATAAEPISALDIAEVPAVPYAAAVVSDAAAGAPLEIATAPGRGEPDPPARAIVPGKDAAA